MHADQSTMKITVFFEKKEEKNELKSTKWNCIEITYNKRFSFYILEKGACLVFVLSWCRIEMLIHSKIVFISLSLTVVLKAE